MKKPVEVSIRSEHIVADEFGASNAEMPPEILSSVAEGYIQSTRQGVKLQFTQTDAEGNSVDTVIHTLKGDTVSIHRPGVPNTSMMFCRGKNIGAFYYIGNNGIQINVSTSTLDNSLSVNGGELDISYSISVVGNVVEKSRVTFSVTPKKKLYS